MMAPSQSHAGSDGYILPPHPPAAGPVKEPDYPAVEEATLGNGLTVLVLPDDRLPRFSVRLGLAIGRQDNPQDNLALASLAVETLAEGTKTRDAQTLAREVDRWAIQLDSQVNLELSAVSVSVLQNHLPHALELLSDMVRNPSFPEEELDKVKVRWRSALVAQRAQPAFLAREAAFRQHFRGHPYSRTEIPLKDLGQATRDYVHDFYRNHFSPERGYLLFAGAIDLPTAIEAAQEAFGGWRQTGFSRQEIPVPVPRRGRTIQLIHRPFSVQSRIQLSGYAPPRPHPDELIFRLTNQVFGGSGSSRIFINLRERHGFTYGAYSFVQSFWRGGVYMASADVGVEVTQAALQEVLSEMEALRQAPPEEAELDRAREEMVGLLIRRLETSASIGTLEIRRRLTGLPADYYSQYVPRLRSCSPQQVMETAQQWFDPENCVITVVGDREKVEQQLEEFGPVATFDSEGNRI